MNAETAILPAPPAYQAEVLRGQIADDVNLRFRRERSRLFREYDERKEQVERDYARMSSKDFLAKYEGWEFAL